MDIDSVTSWGVLLPILAGLALIDSLSFGTLAVPVWLLMAPGQVRVGRVVLYLATIGGFYCALGLVLLFGVQAAVAQWQIDWSHPGLRMLGGLLGLSLLILSFVIEPPKSWRRSAPSAPQRSRGIPVRLAAWRVSAVEAPLQHSSAGQQGASAPTMRGRTGLVGVAVTAGVLEVATMLPYLAAIGLLTASAPALELSQVQLAGLLAAYCVVMLLPALLLLAARTAFASRISPLLKGLDEWFARNGRSTMAWVFGIVGVVLMLNMWS